VGQNHPTERADEKRERKRQVGQQQPNDRIEIRKEQLIENESGHGPVQKVVKPLDGTTGQAGDENAGMNRRGAVDCAHDDPKMIRRKQKKAARFLLCVQYLGSNITGQGFFTRRFR
jgi:hypothetical protein